MAPCCSCNGKNAVCKRCACVRAGRPCISCLPLKFHHCSNILASRTDLVADSDLVGATKPSVINDGAHMSNVSSHSLDSICTTDIDPSLSPQQADDLTGYDSCVHTVDIPLYIDTLIHKAYGAPFICSVGGSYDSVWCQRWSIIYLFNTGAYSILYLVVMGGDIMLSCSMRN